MRYFDLKTKIGLHFGRAQKRMGEGERKMKRKRRRKEEEVKPRSKKVWKLTLIMDSMRFGMDLWFCMVIILPQT